MDPGAATNASTAYCGQLRHTTEQFLSTLKADRFPGCAYQTVEQTRALLAQLTPLAGEPEPLARIEDRIVGNPEVPVRLYLPSTGRPTPVIVYFHGGGWIAGDYAHIDAPVRALANRSGCAIVSVNYRLAPEFKYPAALDDAYAAVTWASREGEKFGWDGSKLAVAGDSAGGNLAAAVALRSRDQNGPSISFQLLVYPALDHDYDNESYRHFGSSWGIVTRTDMIWFHCHYVNHPDELDLPYVSPVRCRDLASLPEALLLLPEADPLKDEGLIYSKRLEEAGVRATARVYAGSVHGFWQLGAIMPEARTAVEEAADAIRDCFSRRKAIRHGALE
jgi:acetyl esterase